MDLIGFDLDLTIDDSEYPGLRISADFYELQRYLDKLCEVVQFTQDQEFIRFKASIEKQSHKIPPADLREKLEQLEYDALNLVPRYFIGAFVIALAAAYESAVNEIAGYVRSKSKAKLRIGDLRESATHKKIALYLDTIMGSGYSLGPELMTRLGELSEVRNCLAHANGNLVNENERRLQTLEALAKAERGVAIRDKSLVVDESFARAYLGYVADAINDLLSEVHRKYCTPQKSGSEQQVE